MSDTPPRLGDAYTAYRGQATDEAAYAQAMARVSGSQAQEQQAPGQQGAQQPQQQQPQQGPTPQQPQQQQPQPQQGGEQPQQPKTPDDERVQAEVDRLASPPFDKSRYSDPNAALLQQARSNLGVDEPQQPQTLLQKAEAVGKDAAYGATVEMPRAVYQGVHGAVRSALKLGDDLDQWMAGKFNDWHLSALNAAIGHDAQGLHLLTGQQAEEMKAAGTAHETQYASGADSVFGAVPLVGSERPFQTWTAGTAIRNTAQFVTGMMMAGGQLRALGLPTNLAGWAGRGVTAAQGFLAQFEAFDGAQHRLSDLVQSIPSLRNPVTEFLSSKPDDTDVEGRLKGALEGSVVGQAADGVIAGLRMLRGTNAAREAVQGFVDNVPRPMPTPSAGLDALGEQAAEGQGKKSIVDLSSEWGMPRPASAEATKTASAAASTEGTTAEEVSKMGEPAEKPPISVNFARIEGPDDIKNAMQNLAGKFSGDIDSARRGVRDFQQTQLGAQAEDAWKVLMDRRVGQPLNDSESLAARQLWASSAAKVKELADIAVSNQSVENLYAFRRMLTTHAAIQEQVIAARTETARALSSWRIPAGDDPLRLEGMVQQLSDTSGFKGGAETTLALAQKVQQTASAGQWDSMGNIAEKTVYAKTRDAVIEGWTNGLLTALGTHVKVAVSNAATVALRMGERAVAARYSQFMGDANGVQMGEASAQYAGLIGGLKDAFRFAGKVAKGAFAGELPALEADPLSNAVKAARTGQYSLQSMAQPEIMQQAGAISAETLGMSNTGWLGNAIDYLGQIARTPGRALTAEHDFFRSIGYRMELHALATRQAIQDVNAGRITQDAMGSRVQELIENPPPQLNLGAVNGALYQTFTDAPGKIAEVVGNARQAVPELRVVLPFYKIPARIMSFTFERSPLAPLMQTYKDNIAAGGTREATARAQIGIGTGLMLAAADSVLSGQMTGAGPAEHGTRAALMNEGWQPYSKLIGNKWVQYNRVETVGSNMAMASDAVEAIRNFQSGVNGDDPDIMNLAAATTFAIANDITSKSYLQSLSNFFDAMANPRTGGNRLVDSLAGSLVPAGVASIDRVTDPYKREVYSMIDAIKARTPGQSESLPPVRNLWGEPVKNASGEGTAFDLLSPMGTREAANEPIDSELLRQGINLSRPPSRTAFDGATLDLNRIDPKMYSRFQELAGNAWKAPDGMGLKDELNALVTGQGQYSGVYQHFGAKGDGPDGPKAEMIQDIVRMYRDGAKQQLMREYPRLADMAREGRNARAQLRSGNIQ